MWEGGENEKGRGRGEERKEGKKGRKKGRKEENRGEGDSREHLSRSFALAVSPHSWPAASATVAPEVAAPWA